MRRERICREHKFYTTLALARVVVPGDLHVLYIVHVDQCDVVIVPLAQHGTLILRRLVPLSKAMTSPSWVWSFTLTSSSDPTLKEPGMLTVYIACFLCVLFKE